MGELVFVGLGLGTVQDMSLRALEELKSCDLVFGEFYTSKLIDSDVKALEALIGKRIKMLERAEVEEGEEVVEEARSKRVAFVTAGDTMAATTHVDLRLHAIELGIATRLVHGVSIFTACASALGLQPYKFGRTITLPFAEKNFLPSSPYENILENNRRGLHSLILLDIRESEGRYMSAAEGVRWLLDAEKRIGGGLMRDDTLVCMAARVGSSSERLLAGPAKEMAQVDMGPPLHALVLPGKLHFMEAEALGKFAHAPPEIAKE
ncbi:MAG TPA: diphthine synthase [Methanomassiliicoccales archaeon]|nr:diphthine synthase [Methanomassiliicoccales archaeon]